MTLKVVDAPIRQVNDATVKELESLLIEAKAGNLIGFIFVGTRADKKCNAGVWGAIETLQTLGLLSTLQHKILSYVNALPPVPPSAA